jgi:hypothetical protein
MAAQVRAVIFTKDYIPPHTQLTWTYNTCTADGGDDLLDGNDVDSSQTSSASQDERAGGDLGAVFTDVAAADAPVAVADAPVAVTAVDTHTGPASPPLL